MRKLALLVCLFLSQPVLAQQVTFANPTDGSTRYLNTTILVRADCQTFSNFRKVDLYVDGVFHGTNNAEPYRWTVDTGSVAGFRTLRAIADYGAQGTVEHVIQIQVAGLAPPPLPAAVTYIGVDKDVTDFQFGLDYGNAGYWFPLFDASSPRSDKPTQDKERNGLPGWAGPMTHMEIWELWNFPQRTFSQDGPTRTKGGFPSWNFFTLPNGEHGLSGIVFDPHGEDNTSQTVNRIDLGPGTPSSFLLRVVVDNTDLRHNPINRIRARGEANGVAIDPPSFPSPGVAGFNGIADVYTFRYDGFKDGDFIKIQFNGMPGSTNNGGPGGSSFAGLLFDLIPTAPAPTPTPTPAPTPTGPTGTTAPGSGSGVTPGSSGGGSGGCALSAGSESATPFPFLLLLLLLLGLAPFETPQRRS